MPVKYLLLTLLFLTSCFATKLPPKIKDSLIDEIRDYNLEGCDTLVDIGCGNGIVDALIASLYPDINFILEDIAGSNLLIESNFKKQNPDRKRSILDHVTIYAGTSTTIPLKKKYKTVISRATMHEFKDRNVMAKELTRILAIGGKLVIVDAISQHEGQRGKGCNLQLLTKQQIVDCFTANGLQLLNYKEDIEEGEAGGIFFFTKRNDN